MILRSWFFRDLLNPLGLFGLSAQAVFMLAQVLGITIYLRNLILIHRRRGRYRQRRISTGEAATAQDSRDAVAGVLER